MQAMFKLIALYVITVMFVLTFQEVIKLKKSLEPMQNQLDLTIYHLEQAYGVNHSNSNYSRAALNNFEAGNDEDIQKD
jgi:hypothetical protein